MDPTALPNVATGMPHGETLTAKGGAAPYQFSVTGTLPPGLSLSAGGVLGGTPTQAGSFSFTVLVFDANGGTGKMEDRKIKTAGMGTAKRISDLTVL